MTDYGKANREYMDRLKDDPEHVARVAAMLADMESWPEVPDPIDPAECTEEHREPQGPNEDLAQCGACWSMTFAMRPEGETFGWHSADCSLPMRHPGYCLPGGEGHTIPATEKIRGFFGPTVVFPVGEKSASDSATEALKDAAVAKWNAA